MSATDLAHDDDDDDDDHYPLLINSKKMKIYGQPIRKAREKIRNHVKENPQLIMTGLAGKFSY